MTSDLTPPRLHARTVEIDDPGDLARWLPDGAGFAWLRTGEGMVAWGEAVRHKPTTVADGAQWWAQLVSSGVAVSELADPPAGSGFLAFGSFVFDPQNTAESSVLVVPEVVVGRRAGRSWVTHIGPDFRSADVRPSTPPASPAGVLFADGALPARQWQDAVAEAVRRIGAGGLDKVVLAREVRARALEDLDPRWLLDRLARRYDQCWTYLVDGLVGATPEMLVRQEAGRVTSRVLAGTLRRSAGPVGRSGAMLSRSSKDLDEHEYAVRSVAAALSPFCRSLDVPTEPYVLELPNLWHLATDLTGVAAQDVSVLALAAALHPSAAVCGTPTEAARLAIAELEQLDRGRYAGPVGWIDGNGDGEWGIALRCGRLDEADPRQVSLYAGCGIVAGSDPRAELAESEAKLVPIRDALSG